MECESIRFSGHALRRIFERSLTKAVVMKTIGFGEVIAEYPEDKPYPSCLMLGFEGNEPVHVVVAREPQHQVCFVVTAYRPKPALWADDFRVRR